MVTLKLVIKIVPLLLIIICCSDRVKSIDDQNFKYIDIVNYPGRGESAKLVMYEKKSNFKKKIKEYNDFSFNFFTPENTNEKALNIKLNFDNSEPFNYDMELVVDNQYYYKFNDIVIRNDTLKKANISAGDLYIYKTMKAKVNDSTMVFDQYIPRLEKSIVLPFRLAKKIGL
ncbi:hypothetical protein [Chryseobacterium sp.]|uniref:hypothetical protein n=1 Tax=Chryseobacterium sp. TaxID=1871047 RepID=UPI0033428CB3